jgi:surface protein
MKHLLFLSITLLLLSAVQAQRDTNDFVTTWRTNLPGVTGDSSIRIYTSNHVVYNYVYNYDVDWDDDGVFDDLNVTGSIDHLYSDTGIYSIRIRGIFPSLKFGEIPVIGIATDRLKLISIDQWGSQSWVDLTAAFNRCYNFVYNAIDVPDLSNVTSFAYMFRAIPRFNGNINNWDVSTVTNMSAMFQRATSFNQPLNSWDVSSVNNMEFMFDDAVSFNQSLDSWDVSSVTLMNEMFRQARAFNQPLNSWDVSSVTSFSQMFSTAISFNQPLDSLNMSSAVNLNGMFNIAISFNQPLNSWDVSSVNDIGFMFFRAISFNQPLNNWDVSSVTNMSGFFSEARLFNQPLNSWDVSLVHSMNYMFRDATSFNQPLDNWRIDSVLNMDLMFDNTALSVTNYDSILIAWEAKPHQLNVSVGVASLRYCNGATARYGLVMDGWNFIGDSSICISVGESEKQFKNELFLLEIFPNPSSGIFNLSAIEDKFGETIQLFNNKGQLLNEKIYTGQELDYSELSEGLYFIRIGNASSKLIISK